jgi:transcriptional regulator with XRE-family HTH domain
MGARLLGVPPPDLLDEPIEIGRRIGAACGYSEKSQEQIARELGRSDKTLRSYAKGNLGDYAGTRELRLSLVRRIEEVTGCPPGLFGLSEPEPGSVDQLRRELADEMEAMKTELLEEIEAVRRAQASAPPIPKPGEGG